MLTHSLKNNEKSHKRFSSKMEKKMEENDLKATILDKKNKVNVFVKQNLLVVCLYSNS